MAKIVIIDDDYSTELLVEHLHFRGHQAKRFKSADLALAGLDEIASADLVVLDVIMEFPAALQPVGISGDRHTGITLLHTFRDKNPDLRVLVFSATSDMSLIDAVKQTPNTCFLPKWDSPSLKEFLIEVERLVGKGTTERLPRCFIVHGTMKLKSWPLKTIYRIH